MAALNPVEAAAPATTWTSAQTRAQFAAIARLRWRMFANGARRKGGAGDLIANLLLAPVALLFVVGPAIGAGAASYFAASAAHITYLEGVLWAIFIISQFANLQFGQPGTTFDPTQLIRFPVSFRGYAIVRVFFGLVSPATVLCCATSLGAAIGISLALPDTAPVTVLALFCFALVSIAFTRMAFTWVDRWMATRRTREVLTFLIVVVSLGFQWVNFTYMQHGHTRHSAQMAALQAHYQTIKPLVELLPPALAVHSVVAAEAGHMVKALALCAGLLLFAAAFFAIFAARLSREFRGENLSEAAALVSAPKPTAKAAPIFTDKSAADITSVPAAMLSSAPLVRSRSTPAAQLPGLFARELLLLRRNSGLFYSLVGPLAMIVILVAKIVPHSAPGVIFGGSVAYAMLGVAPICYNAFGIEGAGVQFFFFSPVSMREVFLAKNLLQCLISLAEVVAVYAAITWLRHAPPPMITLCVLLWAVATIGLSLGMGNMRSITAPKKINLQKVGNKQASPLSALMAVGFVLVMAALGAVVFLLAEFFQRGWVLPAGALVLAALGTGFYAWSLTRLDGLLARHRDGLIEVLAKGD
jgi:ABC-2 type transport system permease protein